MYDLKIFSSFHRMPSNIIIVPLMYRNFLVLYNIIYFYFCLCFLFFWQHIQFLKLLLTPKSWSALPPPPPHSSPPSLSTHKYMLYIAQCALKFISVLLFQPPSALGMGHHAHTTLISTRSMMVWGLTPSHLLIRICLLLMAVRNMIQSQTSEHTDLVFPAPSMDVHVRCVSPCTFDRE